VKTEPPRLTALRTVSVLGVRIHALSLEQLLGLILHVSVHQERAIVAYVNVHAMNLACEASWFRAFFNQSEVVFCDGFGVKWGARLLGARLPERFTPPDWLPRLAELAAQHGLTFFFVGSRPGVAAAAAVRLQAQFPTLKIVGTQHGEFDKTLGCVENDAVVRAINAARPNVLLVGFGMPLQEKWLLENWKRLDGNVALPVGAALDYMAGATPRGPRWMRDHGLEWLARLLIEPRRLWRRYLIGNPLFLWRVLLQRAGLLRFED